MLKIIAQKINSAHRLNISRKRMFRLEKIAIANGLYQNYDEVGFVFQFHNKAANVKKVITPFLEQLNPKHVIFFADCCVDSTEKIAKKSLLGSHHQIISPNNNHEIYNYRMAANILAARGCKYICLLQDDDIYQNPKLWIDNGLKYFAHDKRLSIIGFNGGAWLGEECYFTEADSGLLTALYESVNAQIDGSLFKVSSLGRYRKFHHPQIRRTMDASNYIYAASVNRAPQLINLSHCQELNYFPQDLQPYQYDDYYNCFSAWLNGYRVMLAPIDGKISDVGTGGMRLYNSVTHQRRPKHFVYNHNFIFETFGAQINDGSLQALVDLANARSH